MMIVVIIILLLLLVLSIILNIKMYCNYKNLLERNEVIVKSYYKNRGILSLIEGYMRAYKEGNNPFTSLRDIQNLLYNIGEVEEDVENQDRT